MVSPLFKVILIFGATIKGVALAAVIAALYFSSISAFESSATKIATLRPSSVGLALPINCKAGDNGKSCTGTVGSIGFGTGFMPNPSATRLPNVSSTVNSCATMRSRI